MVERNNKILGTRIKKARRAKGFTQAKLAEGICTQAQISNIEKGTNNDNPSSHTLFLLSEKLGTSMSYLYGQDSATHGNSQDDEFLELKEIINRVKSRRDYVTLDYIIKHEIQDFNHGDEFIEQYLKWHQALVLYYVNDDYDGAEELIQDALEINTNEDSLRASMQKIRIKISRAGFLSNSDKYDEAEKIYDECLAEYKKIKGTTIMNFELIELYNKLIVNLSRVYMEKKAYEKVNELLLDAIDQTLKLNSMDLLGDLYYQLGLSYKQLGMIELYFSNVEKALQIFDLQGNNEMYMYVNKRFEETKSGLKLMSNMAS